MTSKRVMQFVGITLITIALVLIVRTSSVALVLGAAPVAGVPFWFQLSFMRLFATALVGLGAIFLWSASRLSGWLLAGLFVSLAVVCGMSSAFVNTKRA